MHKASTKIIHLAYQNKIGKIIIGSNKLWKQHSNLGKVGNQNFIGIPYYQFLQMITYKAKWMGIKVEIVEESYTSGTSYYDNEMPDITYYNKNRRISRGMFKSNTGRLINADVNASYQIMKKSKAKFPIPIKTDEKITKLQVA